MEITFQQQSNSRILKAPIRRPLPKHTTILRDEILLDTTIMKLFKHII